MANHMAEVAKILGVEMNQDFKCKESCGTYRVTEYGATCNGSYGADSLLMLLNGMLTIVPKPWKPEDGDMFFVVAYDGTILTKYWDDESTTHKTYYKIGNFYRYMEEAKDYREKWLAFYASDEILEV